MNKKQAKREATIHARETAHRILWALWNEGDHQSFTAAEVICFAKENGVLVPPAQLRAALGYLASEHWAHVGYRRAWGPNKKRRERVYRPVFSEALLSQSMRAVDQFDKEKARALILAELKSERATDGPDARTYLSAHTIAQAIQRKKGDFVGPTLASSILGQLVKEGEALSLRSMHTGARHKVYSIAD